jgi:hypothetical protein
MRELLQSMRGELGDVMRDVRTLRPPRGAVLVVAIGLLATIAAALLSSDKLIGVTTLEWVEEAKVPDSKRVAIPGGGEMQLTEADVKATEANIGEYTLFRTAVVLNVSAGSAIGQARLRCVINVPKRTISTKTYTSRASYPRSSEELAEQGTPGENSAVEFSSHGTDFALVEVGDVLGERYTRQKGIVVEWPSYRIGRQVWKYGMPPGRPKEDLTLPMLSTWRTTTEPAAHFSCTVENSSGSATVSTAGKLANPS